jgi:uncharacterized protein (TIGR02099 family)
MGMAQQVILHHGQLHVHDEISGLSLSIDNVDALFEQHLQTALDDTQNTQRFVLKMNLPADLGGAVEVRAHTQGGFNDLTHPSGEIWINAPSLTLPGWRALFSHLPNGELALPVALSDLPQLNSGDLSSQAWLTLHQGTLTDVQASLDLNATLAKRTPLLPAHDMPPTVTPAPLQSHVNIHLQHRDAQWMLDLDTAAVPDSSTPEHDPLNVLTALGLGARPMHSNEQTAINPIAVNIQHFSMRRNGSQLALAAENIDLNLLRPWLIATPILPKDMRLALTRYRPLGMVHDMRMQLNLDEEPRRVQGYADFADLGWQGYETLPSITGLDGHLWLDGNRALLRLASKDISIDADGQLRERLRFNQLNGDIALFWPHPSQPAADESIPVNTPRKVSMLAVRGLELINPDLEFHLDLRLDLPAEGSPQIDARGQLKNVITERIPTYLPVRVLEKDAINWLDQALAQSRGHIEQADLILRGPLNQFPHFPQDCGLFSVTFGFEHINLDYAPASEHIPPPGWPAAEDLRGNLAFIDNGLSGTLTGGQLKGIALKSGSLTIADFNHPRLDLGLKLDGKTEQMLDVLKYSPLFKKPRDLDGLQLSGPAQLDLQMGIRLDPRDQVPDRVEGWLQPRAARLRTFGLDFEQIQGELHFVNLDFDTQNISAQLKQQAAKISVSSQLGSNTPAAERGYRIGVDTQVQLQDWFKPAPSLLQRLPGTFPLRAKLLLGEDFANNPRVTLDLASELQGLRIDLPQPLQKSAESTRPTQAKLVFNQGYIDRIRVQQPGLLDGRFQLRDDKILSASIRFGGDENNNEARMNELLLSGALDTFDLDAWLKVAGNDPESTDGLLPSTLRISTRIAQLHALGGVWEAVNADGLHNAVGWKLELNAPRIDGHLLYPTTPSSQNPVKVDLNRIQFPAEDNTDSKPKTANSIDPGTLPPLQLHIGELRYGDLKLQNIDLSAEPQQASAAGLPPRSRGWIMQPISMRNEKLKIQGQAAWLQEPDGSTNTTLELGFNSDDVGAALSALGIKHSLRQGRLDDSHLKLQWPDAPQNFDWASAQGSGQLHILDGEIDKVEIGAGRVLGLISLTELPRRLMFDFGDVFGSGLHFDRIDSEFKLTNGQLHSTRFELLSSALKLNASGHSNMLDQTLHYSMSATPSLGNVLPIIGTVAGGPLIGGATFVAQKLFEAVGGGFVTLNYQVSGTWDNPIIERGRAPEAMPETKKEGAP